MLLWGAAYGEPGRERSSSKMAPRGVQSPRGSALETTASIVTLAVLIWAVRTLVPHAARVGDRFALACALLALMAAVFLWFLIGAFGVS